MVKLCLLLRLRGQFPSNYLQIDIPHHGPTGTSECLVQCVNGFQKHNIRLTCECQGPSSLRRNCLRVRPLSVSVQGLFEPLSTRMWKCILHPQTFRIGKDLLARLYLHQKISPNLHVQTMVGLLRVQRKHSPETRCQPVC